VLDDKLAHSLVAVLVGGHQRRELILLTRVRVSARLQQQLCELVPGFGILRRHGAVQRHHLHRVP
jgi:hypothetical protein